MAADACRVPRDSRGALQPRRERINGGLIEEHAGLAVDHGVERAAAAKRHDGPATGLRLNWDDAKVFFTRQDGRDRGPIELTDFFVGAPAGQLNAVAGLAFEVAALGPVADNRQSEAGLSRRHHCEIDPLVRYEC